jgi:hypothetical protein
MKESIKCRQVLSEVINIKGYLSFMTEKPDEYL